MRGGRTSHRFVRPPGEHLIHTQANPTHRKQSDTELSARGETENSKHGRSRMGRREVTEECGTNGKGRGCVSSVPCPSLRRFGITRISVHVPGGESAADRIQRRENHQRTAVQREPRSTETTTARKLIPTAETPELDISGLPPSQHKLPIHGPPGGRALQDDLLGLEYRSGIPKCGKERRKEGVWEWGPLISRSFPSHSLLRVTLRDRSCHAVETTCPGSMA